MSAPGGPRAGVVLGAFAGGLAVVFAAAFGLGRTVAPTDPAPPPAPVSQHPVTADMTDMTDMTVWATLSG